LDLIFAATEATGVQKGGAFGFGALLGWSAYFLNRYRKEVVIGDLGAIVGAIGGAAILALFPAKSDLFGYYGIGLASGFFGYLAMLLALTWRSPNFGIDWFLDGRRRELAGDQVGPDPNNPNRPSIL
jgi:hypothetical protein